MSSKIYCDVAVIGAGAAGLMAAGRAAQLGAKVVLVEKNARPGVKLLLTGKQRCNITCADESKSAFVSAIGDNGKFLFSALQNFGVRETLDFFHNLGLETKVENGTKVFPKSDKASDVLNTLLTYINEYDVQLLLNTAVKHLESANNQITGIHCASQDIVARNYIVCTGGQSYPSTGSNGEGYLWAQRLGHSVVTPAPALVAICLDDPWLKEVQAVELKNVQISLLQNDKIFAQRLGDAMFTHEGISGPMLIEVSKLVGQYLKRGKVSLQIDFFPSLSLNEANQKIQRDYEQSGNRAIKNCLSQILPRRLIPIFIAKSHVHPDKMTSVITKEERTKLACLLKSFPVNVSSLGGFAKAIITTGGICLKEINSKTMGSNVVSNLYFAGEVIDLDGPTGGYNLQICWSTGYAAGTASAT